MMLDTRMHVQDVDAWLRETEETKLAQLWDLADRTRQERVGNSVFFRGLIEISNYCSRKCLYCGLRGERTAVERYRMTDDEIKTCAVNAKRFGYGTVVLQSGEDPGFGPDRIAALIQWIKHEVGLAVTLSLGEQSLEVFRLWKDAGANRYLLRIETTDDQLMQVIHPGEPHGSRKANIDRLFDLGYEVGSGVMVGIPGQTFAILAKDLAWFRERDFDMIGIGPYLAHPDTPLAHHSRAHPDQVPDTELTTHKAVALTRILCPEANLPATTALATVNKTDGREMALQRGANVVMPNLTPVQYRRHYEIYPSKACIDETADMCQTCLQKRIRDIGREVGSGPGGRNRRV